MLPTTVSNGLTACLRRSIYNCIYNAYTSLFLQGIDVDAHYKNYSLGVRKSLEAWSGSQIDLGLVCVYHFLILQKNLYFIY